VLCLLTWSVVLGRYHTGSLYLGIINGPTEGIQMIATIYFLTYWFGTRDDWHRKTRVLALTL